MLNAKFLVFANKQALHNPVQIVLYTVGYFFAKNFQKLGISPNGISILSLFLGLFACYALIQKDLKHFYLFWSFSYALDYADGTLARITNKIGKRAFRVDHMCDQVKIISILLGIGIYYNLKELWILSFLTSSIFLLYTLINHDLEVYKKIEKSKPINKNNINKKIKSKKLHFIYSIIYKNFIIINGHSLLIIFFMPINEMVAAFMMIYFLFICILHSVRRSIILYSKNRLNFN